MADGYTRRETEGSETCKTGFPFVRVMYTSKITDSLLAHRVGDIIASCGARIRALLAA